MQCMNFEISLLGIQHNVTNNNVFLTYKLTCYYYITL